MAPKEYTQLTPTRQRRRFSFVSSSRSSLWLGKDHLLLVDTEGYTESYKRFYLRDIQAIILRRNSRMLVILIVTGLITALLGFAALAITDEVGKWIFGTLSGTVAIPFLINVLYGPACSCKLQTAVQTEDVPSMSRVRRARKVLARIRPLIAEAQGQLSPEEVAARMQGKLELSATATAAPPILNPAEEPSQSSD